MDATGPSVAISSPREGCEDDAKKSIEASQARRRGGRDEILIDHRHKGGYFKVSKENQNLNQNPYTGFSVEKDQGVSQKTQPRSIRSSTGPHYTCTRSRARDIPAR